MATLQLADIQGIIMSGYGHLNYSRYLFFRISNREVAKPWIGRLSHQITTERPRERSAERPETRVNIAFTAKGLRKLGLTDDALLTFPRQFVSGMADRYEPLGDLGESAPSEWQVGGPHNEADLLLVLYGLDSEILNNLTDGLCEGTELSKGLEEVFRQDAVRHTANEPFGFRDGISQPAIEGAPHPAKPGQSVLKAGEFILGYENQYGEIAPMPTEAAASDPLNRLPPHPPDPGRRALGSNGSFLVVRKLVQDVKGFWDFADRQTRNADGSSNPQQRTLLASKLVGRWPSGAPLVLAPHQDDKVLGRNSARNNAFLYNTSDVSGLACPIGSHIRRANPRDSLPPDPAKSIAISNRHRIIRRGRPFGMSDATGEHEHSEQGLMFLAVNTDLERQFEFIQQNWINSPKFGGLFDNKDPIVSDNGLASAMTIPGTPVRRRLQGLPQFVTTRGGGYFFLPGIRTLRFLASPQG